MIVQKHHVVVLSYDLKTDAGDLVDQATTESPFAFIHGIGQTLPAFDEALEGKKAEEAFSFSITAENGYGAYEQERLQKIPADIFADAPEGTLELGRTLPMQYNDPNNPGGPSTIYGTVTEVTDTEISMDFNHPLAGQNLNFSGTIIEVREATKVEMDHGHVHGEHGVEH